MTGAVVMRTSGGIVQRNPTENRLRALLGALSRNEYFILERVGLSQVCGSSLQISGFGRR